MRILITTEHKLVNEIRYAHIANSYTHAFNFELMIKFYLIFRPKLHISVYDFKNREQRFLRVGKYTRLIKKTRLDSFKVAQEF